MNFGEKSHKYEDILNLPHHTSSVRAPMKMIDRAAQFSPFAALTGYDAAIQETARLTDERIELDENSKQILDERLQLILENQEKSPRITITYFQPDEKKSGGSYVSVTGCVKKIDPYEKCLVMQNQQRILLQEILEIDGEIFNF